MSELTTASINAMHHVLRMQSLAGSLHTEKSCVGQSSVWLQGDKEKAMGMTVSPLMDRKNKGGITRSQM